MGMKKRVSVQVSPISFLSQALSFWSLVAAGMGPWWALWLTLTLPQILEGQIPSKLQGFPELTSFHNDQVQGFQRKRRRLQLARVPAFGGRVYAGP